MKNKYLTGLVACLMVVFGLQSAYSQNINHPNIKCPGGLNVNTFNGNLYLERSDLFIKGRKFNLDMTFYYNSVDLKRNYGYGNGWGFQYLVQYVPDSSGITIRYATGFESHFTTDSSNTNLFHAAAGTFDSLSQYQPGKYLFITKSKMKYFFDSALHKRLTRIEEPNGNFLNFAYTDSLITQVSDAAGRSIQLAYTGGKLTSLTDAIAAPTRTVQYSYDTYGNLTEVTDPAGNKSKYKYLVNGPMSAVSDKNANTVDIIYQSDFKVQEVISCITDQRFSYNAVARTTYLVETVESGNQVSSYEFDGNGNMKKQVGNCCGFNMSFEYDDDKNMTSYTDANGNKYKYTYDGRGNRLSEKDPLGNSTFYTYEPVFNKITSITDKNGNTTSYGYDAKGNLTLVSYPLSITNSFIYDANGDLVSTTDGNGNTTTYAYDSFGNLTAKNRPLGATYTYTYDARSRQLTKTNPLNHTTSYGYDQLDRLTSLTDALNNITNFAYDANGFMLSRTDALNHVTTFARDALNRLVMITNAIGGTKKFSYDSKTNMIAYTDENGIVTKSAFDNLNRAIANTNAANETTVHNWEGYVNLTSITYPNGNQITYIYDQLNRVISESDAIGMVFSYTYDNLGNKLTKTNGNGNSTAHAYDALNRLISTSDAFGNTMVYSFDGNSNVLTFKDKNNHISTYTYDALNRKISETDALGNITTYIYDLEGNQTAITDANNHTTTYTYDALNRKTGEVYANGTSQNYGYDAVGNKITRTDGNGAITSYTYDALRRLTLRDFPGINDDVYSYDNTGRILTASNGNASLTFTYDAANRLTSETLNGKAVGYTYDTPGKKRSLLYPGGRTIVEQYDERSRLVNVLESGSSIANFTYDDANRNTNVSYANGTSTNIIYDAGNRIVSMLSSPGGFHDFLYTYDNNGNKLFEKENHHPAQSEQYQYDNIDQLIEFKTGTLSGTVIPSPVAQSHYNYDNLGNRTSMNVDANITTYASNSVNAYTTISGAGTINPTYDNNGNLLNDATYSFSYDEENRLIAVNSGAAAVYKYDALGRRIQKILPAQTINYYYSGKEVIEEYDGADILQASYIYASWIDDILTMQRNSNNYYYHKNATGSVVALTDNSGEIVESYEYDAFGKIAIYDGSNNLLISSAVNNAYMFTGREYNPEISNYYYRARFYDYNKGRFLQKDPLGYVDGMNLYTYADNNPINFIDPLGTTWYCRLGAQVAGTGVCVAGAVCFLGVAAVTEGVGGLILGFGCGLAGWVVSEFCQVEDDDDRKKMDRDFERRLRDLENAHRPRHRPQPHINPDIVLD